MSKKKVYMYQSMLGILREQMCPGNPTWLPTVFAKPPGKKYVAIHLDDGEDEEDEEDDPWSEEDDPWEDTLKEAEGTPLPSAPTQVWVRGAIIETLIDGLNATSDFLPTAYLTPPNDGGDFVAIPLEYPEGCEASPTDLDNKRIEDINSIWIGMGNIGYARDIEAQILKPSASQCEGKGWRQIFVTRGDEDDWGEEGEKDEHIENLRKHNVRCDSCNYPAEHAYCEPCYQSAGKRIGFAENQAECSTRTAEMFAKDAQEWEARALAAENLVQGLLGKRNLSISACKNCSKMPLYRGRVAYGDVCECDTYVPGGKKKVEEPKLPTTGWEYLQAAIKNMKKVNDGDTRIVLTHLLNALRYSVDFDSETKSKSVLVQGKLIPTNEHVRMCAEELHSSWCPVGSCSWKDNDSWANQGTEKGKYAKLASLLLQDGIDVNDARRVMALIRDWVR